MKKLWEYLYRRIKVVTVDGREYEGEMDLYSSAEDSGDDEDSIGLCTNEETGDGPLIFASEIKSIEELPV